MKYIQKTSIYIVIFTLIVSCSTKKDSVISRNFHAVTTKYNVLFNGKEALSKGIEELNNNYKDDYWKQLPIEPITFEEDKIIIPTYTDRDSFGNKTKDKDNKEENKEETPFDRAEEKAVKAIQKHSMNINNRERNRQIDDAYLLLGKSRYYSQRFIPAIEAFNYVIAHYPFADLINETKIWRAKANIRNDNEELAIESLKSLIEIKENLEQELPNNIRELAHTALAMAYVKTDSIEKVKKHLIKATETLENREQSARNLFILGQIYSQEDKKDSAAHAFHKVIDFKKAPYKYRIQAHIELAKNFSKDSSSAILLEKFEKLIKNRDNRPYLDKLYYQVGVLHENNDSVALAVDYYRKSLRAKDGEAQQKTYTYNKLGDINFKNAAFTKASAYYDSVLKVATDSTELRIRRVKRKHKNLASLIKFEKVIYENDSILKIASLSEEDQKDYFEKYIEKIKKEDEDRAQQRLNALAFGNLGGNNLQTTGKQGKWYFYNNQSLGFGKTEFFKIWGERALVDNWRWSNKTIIDTTSKDSTQVETTNKRYDLASYLNTIPKDKNVIDSLQIGRNTALYELGVIYKEQFNKPNLAIQRLERLLQLNKDKELELPIHWHLYQIYKKLDNQKHQVHKELILTKYPETKFAQLILFPGKKIEEKISIDELENTYKEIYYLYKERKFEEVVQKIEVILPTIQETKLVAKFELLKAFAIGQYNDKFSYAVALNFVAVNYANTEEGRKAKEVLDQLSK